MCICLAVFDADIAPVVEVAANKSVAPQKKPVGALEENAILSTTPVILKMYLCFDKLYNDN